MTPKQERVFVPLWLTREEAETILHSGRSGWDKIVYARTEDAIRRALDGTAKAWKAWIVLKGGKVLCDVDEAPFLFAEDSARAMQSTTARRVLVVEIPE